jgi:ABC-type phosphate transport system substrate-binding protein
MRPHLLNPFLLAISLVAGAAWAGDVYVIAGPGVNVSAEEVRDIFMGEKQFAGGVKLVPIDNTAVQADFLPKVIRMDAEKDTTTWVKKGFREGLRPPLMRGGDAESIRTIKSTPGAIGYVSRAPADVRIIHKF